MQRARAHQSTQPFLARLPTLCLQKLPNEEIEGASDEAIPEEFLNIWNFTRLHASRFKGCHEFRKDISWVHRLRELKLVSGVAATELFRVCQLAVELESLSLIITRDSTFPPGFPPDGEDLNCALLARATTLRILEFRICGNLPYRNQLGQSKLLDCLPALKELNELTVDVLLVYGLEGEAPTLSKFPPQLASLNLVEAWWPSRGPYIKPVFAQSEVIFVERLLSEFVLDAYEEFPQLALRQLCLTTRFGNSCLNSYKLDSIKLLFNSSKVSFSYEVNTIPLQCIYYMPLHSRQP
ncbi:hypothetical protein F5Y13DRAFT_101382 [Hypoxylon sp. FL1857]|nr:hypothetical protein F5Y13DRAFT_101382 [Hypoxylon sp. FL1857]